MDEILDLVAALKEDNPGHQIKIYNCPEKNCDFVLKAERFYAGIAPDVEFHRVSELADEYKECKVNVSSTEIDEIFSTHVRSNVLKHVITVRVKV